jgi:glutamate racemase
MDLPPSADRPVGVFDSGVGGLSVLREIRRELSAEDLVYIADSGFAPYGDRPVAFIMDRAEAMLRHLRQCDVKAVVVACNTATSVAVDALRARTDMPIVGIEPAVKPAALETRSRVVGVLATTQTLATVRFERLVSTYGASIEVVVQPCPGLAELVEQGAVSGPEVTALIERYVRPLVARGADVLVLGCTHYAFLSRGIQTAAGPGVRLLDPAVPVAREVRRRLTDRNLLSTRERPGVERFWTSGVPEDVQAVVARLWDAAVHVKALPSGLAPEVAS